MYKMTKNINLEKLQIGYDINTYQDVNMCFKNASNKKNQYYNYEKLTQRFLRTNIRV